MVNLRKYFRRPRFPWFAVYLVGAVLLVMCLWPVAVLSLGSFRLGAVIGDWATFCVSKEGVDE